MKTPSIKLLILSGLFSLNLAFIPVPVKATPTATNWTATAASGDTWTAAGIAGWGTGGVGPAPISGASGYEATFTNTAGLETTITIAPTGVSSAGISFSSATTPSYTFNGGSLTLDFGTADNGAGVIITDSSTALQTFNQNVILADSADTTNTLGMTYNINGASAGSTIAFNGGLTIGKTINTLGSSTTNLTLDFGGPVVINNSAHTLSLSLTGTSGDIVNWDATSTYAIDAFDIKNASSSTSVTNVYTDPTAFATFGGTSAVGGTVNVETNGLTVNSTYSTGDTTTAASQLLELIRWHSSRCCPPSSASRP